MLTRVTGKRLCWNILEKWPTFGNGLRGHVLTRRESATALAYL